MNSAKYGRTCRPLQRTRKLPAAIRDFRYFSYRLPYAFDIRKSYVTTTGKTCFSFTIARTCLARSGTNSKRRDVRKTFLGKQTYLHINRTQLTATSRHAIIASLKLVFHSTCKSLAVIWQATRKQSFETTLHDVMEGAGKSDVVEGVRGI